MVSGVVLAEVQDQTLADLVNYFTQNIGGICRVYKKADYDFSPWQRIKR
jgi:hypothetical protein